jgi:phosphate transport system permease protein
MNTTTSTIVSHSKNPARVARFNQRRVVNMIALVAASLAMAFGMFFLFWILFDTVRLGAAGMNAAVFTEMTPPPNESGGLVNAIYGSVLMTAIGTLIGTPIGILSGIYLSEYAKHGRFSNVIRLANDILLSAPSIIIGLFIYGVVVVYTKTFSGLAGALALSLIVIPIVVRTTEDQLSLVPITLREAAYALGTPKWKVIQYVVLKSARAGIVTGFLLAVARIIGETAPLLLTALSNQFWSNDISKPIASLPVTIFKFALSPYENWQKLAWAAVLLIAIVVPALNVLARFLTRKKI